MDGKSFRRGQEAAASSMMNRCRAAVDLDWSITMSNQHERSVQSAIAGNPDQAREVVWQKVLDELESAPNRKEYHHQYPNLLPGIFDRLWKKAHKP